MLLLLTTSYLLPATYHLLTCYYLLPSIYYMQAVADRRLQDEQRSSNNSKTRAVAAAATEAAAAACSTVEQLVQKLERARQLRGSGALQEVERCEAELEAARAELEVSRGQEARANSLVTSLRRSQSAAEVTRLREAKVAEEARARVAEKSVKQHKAHLEVVEEEREAAALVARRAAKAHTVALQRGRDARAETKAVQRERDALAVELSTKDAKLDAMAVELAREQVAALHRQAEADVRLSEVCARLEAGDARARQMKQELEGLQEQLEADAKDAASKHAFVEEQLRDELRGSQAALAAYQNFQAKEGGAYKDCVRLCYYSLIDKKVGARPTSYLALLGACATCHRPAWREKRVACAAPCSMRTRPCGVSHPLPRCCEGAHKSAGGGCGGGAQDGRRARQGAAEARDGAEYASRDGARGRRGGRLAPRQVVERLRRLG